MKYLGFCIASALLLLVAATDVRSEAPRPDEAREVGPFHIQLNKLEAIADACRAYFVVQNDHGEHLDELQTDIFLFDRDDVILRRVALSFPDIRPGREKVVLFDFGGLGCRDIGRLLVNDVLVCKSNGSAIPGCGDNLVVSSRAEAAITY